MDRVIGIRSDEGNYIDLFSARLVLFNGAVDVAIDHVRKINFTACRGEEPRGAKIVSLLAREKHMGDWVGAEK